MTSRSLVVAFVLAVLPSALLASDGFIDRTGTVVIEPRFDQALSFSGGLAAVRVGKKWGFIDAKGQAQISPQFDEAWSFHDGLARVKVGATWGFIDTAGQWVVPAQFRCASDFSEGLAAVCAPRQSGPGDSGQGLGWGYIDTTGKLVIAPQFFEAADFSEGLAMVRRTGGAHTRADAFVIESGIRQEVAGYIDKTGALVIAPQFARAMPFSEGLAFVQRLDQTPAYIDTTGKVAIERKGWAHQFSDPIGLEGASFHEGLALTDTKAGFVHVPKWAFMDTKGAIVMPMPFARAFRFHEGLAMVMAGKLKLRYGFVDKTGKVIAEPRFKSAWPFSQGLAPVMTDKKWGYIDTTGRMVIEEKFAAASPFSEGLAKVTLGR